VKLAGAAEDEAGTVRLVDRLLAAARDHLGRDRDQIVRSLEALQRAQSVLPREPAANPRVVLAAAVLSDFSQAERGVSPEKAAVNAETMREAGFDEVTIQQVAALLIAGDAEADTPEARVMRQVRPPLSAPEPAGVAAAR
jgi:hypothetical protein